MGLQLPPVASNHFDMYISKNRDVPRLTCVDTEKDTRGKMHSTLGEVFNQKELGAHIWWKFSPNWWNLSPKYEPPTPTHYLAGQPNVHEIKFPGP